MQEQAGTVDIALVEGEVRRLLTTRLGIPAEQIHLDARLVEDLELDSIDAVELALTAEQLFNVDIREEEFETLKTVGDIVNMVHRSYAGAVVA